MSGHDCLDHRWPWVRLQVRQYPDCGSWWIAQPVSVSRLKGGWERAWAPQVWWARKRGRMYADDGGAARGSTAEHGVG